MSRVRKSDNKTGHDSFLLASDVQGNLLYDSLQLRFAADVLVVHQYQ